MKFTDGYWMLADGVQATYATHVRDLETDGSSLTAYAPSALITSRGDTLNRPLLTVRYSTPMPDVIRVQVTHHAGGIDPGPRFELHRQPVEPEIRIDADEGVLTSGGLTLRLQRGDRWAAGFEAGGRTLVREADKSAALMTMPDGAVHTRAQLVLGVGDLVYGLGERFGPVVKNGQRVDIWNADGGTSSEQAYKNVPFFLTNAGYGVFVNHPEQVSFEVGSEAVSRVQFSVPGQGLDYFIIHGPSPKEILSRYTALTGRPPQVPAWSYGLWLTTSFTTSYDEATVTSFVDGMAERGIPLSVFHFDCFWMREFHWCDFVWDPATFPDPPGMLARLHERGLRVCVWINPYIAQRSELFDEGRRLGYLVRRPDGSVWQWDLWQAGMGLVDFTNPDATAWFQAKLATLLDMGVDCFKTDFGERIPTDVAWFDGSDPAGMHNYYTQLYNEAVFEVLRERRGEGEAVLFARSATAGGQQFPVHWGGDCDSSWESMAETLRGGLSLAYSGFGYWSHDIGGFEGTPDVGVFKRWLTFGLLSSHSRLHGSGSYRVPWAFDDEAVEITRRFTRLKARLMPYLLEQARAVTAEGWPLLRPMLLEFPDDPAVEHLDRQYLLGSSLLVAPVFNAEGTVRFYVPAGPWTNLLTGERLVGPRWVTQTHGFDTLPLLVRPDSVLPLGAGEDGPVYDWADGAELLLHELADGHRSTVVVPGAAGDRSFQVTRTGSRIEVTAGGSQPWSVRLPGGDPVTAPAGTSSIVLDLDGA